MNISRILLDAAPEGTKQLAGISEKLSTGFIVLALGIVTVFAVLVLLWLVLILFKLIFYREKKTAAVKPTVIPEPIAAPAVIDDRSEDDGELVAAIMAAVAAFTEDDDEFSSGFKVVSFRRAEKASPWNKTR